MSKAPEHAACGHGRSALVLGATGLVGGKVLDLLLVEPLYERVIAVTRRKIEKSDPCLEQHIINFADMEKVLQSVVVDDIYCCLGTTMKKAGSKDAFQQVDYEYPWLAAKCLRQHSEHFLLISALGANPSSNFFYNRVKGKLESALIDLGFPFLTIVRPSLLLGERKDSRLLESVGLGVARLATPLLRSRFARYAAVEADAVARTLIREGVRAAERQRPEHLRIIESEAICRV
ncbi:NAD-dependent epimerase/dehydratase family protein [Hahella sp. CCB-MM4]|uniref:NAD-dependent epimerase/dehydratase family protein n=1 Tax=Hahella sp. (strain CCB-MM4) TaxID=1926491 RepID=UPI00143D0919|nr:NAD-dependent epimerase/dehydratase family protein [Hahella sp. CCB-MM4]